VSAQGTTTLEGFLLTRQWRDSPRGLEISFWMSSERGPCRINVAGEHAICFVDRDATLPRGVHCERRALDLTSLHGAPVDGLYFDAQRQLQDAVAACAGDPPLHEADIKPSDRFLMERFVTAGMRISGNAVQQRDHLRFDNPRVRRARHRPRLRWLSLDIETQGLDGRLYSIAVHSPRGGIVFLVSDTEVQVDGVEVRAFAEERGALQAFFQWLRQDDPDLIIGWNLVNFDLDYLARRCADLALRFDMARGDESAAVLAPSSRDGVRVARLPGRVALDGIELLKAAFWSFESFELQQVASELLGRGKLIAEVTDRVAAIDRLYATDRPALVAYNIEDCRLVADVFERAGLVEFAVRRSELTGLALDRMGGSVAAFDNLYLPRLHRHGAVAPSLRDVPRGGSSPGGYVLDSQPGLYDDVLVLDFKSLYPSLIRTFRIDPLGLARPGADPVPGFKGALFCREQTILPELIKGLWAERDAAKRRGDAAMSQAVKILMNSFYGVLGASGCRFHDHRLASSITLRGHEVIQRSRERIEAEGFRVIYGDTDSLFVLHRGDTPPADAGAALAALLNRWWRDTVRAEFALDSFLEIEFETHFLRFLMPTVRGEQTGSKKRYAGLVRRGEEMEVVFKGLESVRTDWTPLARRFQRELYRRVFLREPYEELVSDTLEGLLQGRFDADLVYRKRLRRRVDDYTHNVPPHVQAARKLDHPVRTIRYVMTRSGPEPVREDVALPALDYEHYRTRQLAPAADGILKFLDTSFAAITDAQMSMF
jgi:DNA polymerase-2